MIPLLEKGNRNQLKAHTNDSPAEQGFFYVAFSPEREDPGNTDVARRDIPKVIGSYGAAAGTLAAALYGSIFNRTVPVSSPAAAEMTKLLENIYRCVNIALVNELKQLCQRMGIDLFEVIDAAKTKPFGFQPFYPGLGVGGHCIPINPFYLLSNNEMPLLESATRSMWKRPQVVAHRALASLRQPDGFTETVSLLMCAASTGNLPAVRLLLAAGAASSPVPLAASGSLAEA